MPHPYNKHFQSREALWLKLTQHFSQNYENPYVVLTGFGGNGKTTLASQWAHEQKKQKKDLIIRWMSMDNASIDISLKNLARDLGINTDKKERDSWLKEVAQAINQSSWLIVWDNVDNYMSIADLLNKYFKPCNKQQQLLITTRDDVSWGKSDRIDVDVYTTEESLHYIQHQMEEARHLDWNENQAKTLAECLGYHPLALELVMGQICLYKYTLESYIQKLKKSNITALDEEKLQGLDYQLKINEHTITTLWKVGVENLSVPAISALYFMSIIYSENIRQDLLLSFFNNDEIQYRNALLFLKGQSFIKCSSNSGNDNYSIHRLLQQVVRKNSFTTIKVNEIALRGCTALMTVFWPDNKRHNDPKYLEEGIVHGESIKNYLEGDHKAELLLKIGDNEQKLARYKIALTHFNDALAILKSSKKEDIILIARTLYRLGLIEKIIGSLDLSRKHYEEAREIYENLLKKRLIEKEDKSIHRSLGGILTELAEIYKYKGEYPQAMECYENAESENKKSNANIAYEANLLLKKGDLYRITGDIEKARKCCQMALDLNRKGSNTKITNQSHVAHALIELGKVYYVEGDYASTRKYYDEALSINKRIHENRPHIYLANNYRQLGKVCFAQNYYVEAKNYYKRALKEYRTIYGADANRHEIAKTLENLGQVYRAEKNCTQAIHYFNEALKMYEVLSKEKYADKIQLLKEMLSEFSLYASYGCVAFLSYFFIHNNVMSQISNKNIQNKK